MVKTVYLGKSNNASKKHIEEVREFLKSKHIKVIEYTGGDYDRNLIHEADLYLFISSEENNLGTSPNNITIGKGLYGEIMHFKGPILCFMDIWYDGRTMDISTIDIKRISSNIEIINETDYKKYASVKLMPEVIHLNKLL